MVVRVYLWNICICQFVWDIWKLRDSHNRMGVQGMNGVDLVACDVIILVTTSGQLYRIRDIFVLFYNVRIPQPDQSDMYCLTCCYLQGNSVTFFFFVTRYVTSLLLRR